MPGMWSLSKIPLTPDGDIARQRRGAAGKERGREGAGNGRGAAGIITHRPGDRSRRLCFPVRAESK